MTAFMLACYLNGVAEGGIYFRSVADCVMFSKYLSKQEYSVNGEAQIYECICKLVPKVNDKKVRVY
jgi:hypothetical protein